MIVKMKEIYLLCMKKHSEEALQRLALLGAVHVTPSGKDETPATQHLRREVDRAKQAFEVLVRSMPKKAKARTLLSMSARAETGCDIVHKTLAIEERIFKLEEQLLDLESEKTAIEPLGQFDPELFRKIKARGMHLKLLSQSKKLPAPSVKGVSFSPIGETASLKYLLAVAQEPFEVQDADEIPLPKHTLGDVLLKIESCYAEIDVARIELAGLSLESKLVERYIAEQSEALMFSEARDAMSAEGEITYLHGFCPIDSTEAVLQSAKEHGWGIMLKDPGKDSDEPPSLVRYPAWVKPIKAVFDMIEILPGYREADISMVFLLFFSVFFAMLIGDAGYGILFLLLTAVLRLKMPHAPSYPFTLFGILSICTIIWGVLTANYFGIATEHLPPLLSETLRIKWLATDAHVMKLCFLIGATHLTVAHVWNAIVLFPDKKFLAQIGWICLVWTMFLAAMSMVLNEPVSTALVATLGISAVVLIALFMSTLAEFKSEWINHAMLPLNFISCFVDVMSYVRLFAVGLASLYVARSFNDMAMDAGAGNILLVPLTALILLIGHGLNIALCALGILVHGIRLNTLEFSLHKGMQWSGRPFKPLSINNSGK